MGIPRTILIDAQGKIVYDATGMDEDQLRTEIAKLGSEYAALGAEAEGSSLHGLEVTAKSTID
jgi:hypothetical protein